MSVFSVNQVRHLYVATAQKTSPAASDSVGTCNFKSVGDDIYLTYVGAGGMTRSDLINKNNILWAKAIAATNLDETGKVVRVELDSDVNSGDPVSGQDYILRILFENAFGMSDEDYYFKYGAVHATSATTATKFYWQMAKSILLNMSRELNKFISVYLVTDNSGDVDEEVTLDNIASKEPTTDNGYTYVAIKLAEAPQDWKRGTMSQDRIHFNVYCGEITFDGDELIWGTVKDNIKDGVTLNAGSGDITPVVATSGHKLADLEWFCMGARGDEYRMIGWPNYVPTEYLIDPTASDYYILEIHYAFVDSNEGVQKSEKDITVVGKKTAINSLIGAWNSASGMSISTFS